MRSRPTLFFCLMFCFVPSETSEVVEVSCVFLESCVLHCDFEPGDNPLVHWTKEPEGQTVHTYFHGQHGLNYQHKNYKHRTSLSGDVHNGNASLLLQKVKSTDEGRYKCFVRTLNPEKNSECNFNLKLQDRDVSCVHLESCVLPCVFHPGEDPVIHWTKEPEHLPVHVYFRSQHQHKHQHKNYTDRTTLSDNGIRNGYTSLLLKKVKVSDEGRYRCFVSTINPDQTTEYYYGLKVYAPVLQVSLQQQKKQLLCRSENIYPRPDVTWTFSSDPQDEPQTTFTSSESGLFSVLSSVSLTERLPLEYSCNISTERCWRSATYRRNTSISASGSVTVPCSEPSAPVKTLIWRSKHSETVLTRTGSELVYTESWRQFVEELTESNSLVLKDLTQDQLGLFTCELFTESEQFIIDTEVTEVTEVTKRKHMGLKIFLGFAIFIILAAILRFRKILWSQCGDLCKKNLEKIPSNDTFCDNKDRDGADPESEDF